MNLLLSLLTGIVQPAADAAGNASNASNAADAAAEGVTQAAQQAAGGIGMWGMVLYILFFVAIFYFFIIRPQKKKEKQLKEMQDSVKVGDDVMTSSGFFGKVVDIQDDVAIVEFGTNKGVRIPVKKSEIYGNKSAGTNTSAETK